MTTTQLYEEFLCVDLQDLSAYEVENRNQVLTDMMNTIASWT